MVVVTVDDIDVSVFFSVVAVSVFPCLSALSLPFDLFSAYKDC